MNSLVAVQAENGLWHELWIVAVDEAYSAKDAPRRMEEIFGLPKREVVNVYFAYHPEMKRWAEDHIKARTCEAAIHDLQEMLKDTQDRRRAQQPKRPSSTPVDASDHWMAPFKGKPGNYPSAPVPLVIEGEAETTKAGPRKNARAAFEQWIKDLGSAPYPTRKAANEWAKAGGYSTEEVRKLHSQSTPRGRGRPRSG